MPQNDVPELRTERLTLRSHTRADFDDSFAMWSHPDVTKHIGGRPFTREECWARLLRYGGMWPLLGMGFWVARETATGAFVGEVGVTDFGRELEPGFGDTPETGWALAASAHGKGYATEAMRAVVGWADSQLRTLRTVCMINPDNAASIAVAAKLGYAEYARADYKGSPVVLYERQAPTT